jgi:hypothetical protein
MDEMVFKGKYGTNSTGNMSGNVNNITNNINNLNNPINLQKSLKGKSLID